MKFLSMPPIPEEVLDWIEKWIEEAQRITMAKSASYSAYDQVAVPSAGTTGEHPDVCDTVRPESHRQNQHEFVAKERPVEELRATRKLQLGSNGMQGN